MNNTTNTPSYDDLSPELQAIVNQLANQKVELAREERNAKARERNAEKAEARIVASREISGLDRLNISKKDASEIAKWDTVHCRYTNVGKLFMAISFKNELKDSDPRKYHLARSVDESGFYLYPTKAGNTILCYVNITNRNVRQFFLVDPVGTKMVQEILAKLPRNERVIK